jgi:hypothetical protein
MYIYIWRERERERERKREGEREGERCIYSVLPKIRNRFHRNQDRNFDQIPSTNIDTELTDLPTQEVGSTKTLTETLR